MQNTISCLDKYMCRGLKLQKDHEAVLVYKYMQKMETVKQWGLWSRLNEILILS